MEKMRAAFTRARKGEDPQRSIRRRRSPASSGSDGGSQDWGYLRRLRVQPGLMRRHRIVALSLKGAGRQSFDSLSARLLQIMRSNNWRSVAVTSPSAGCGKTTTCLNLAFALARQREVRAAVLDADLARPGMARVLGITGAQPIASLLKGVIPSEEVFVRVGDTLAIGCSDQADGRLASLLKDPKAVEGIHAVQADLEPDLMLFDLPSMENRDDVRALMPHVDCVLIVGAAEQSTRMQIRDCVSELGGLTNVVGVILNKTRYGG